MADLEPLDPDLRALLDRVKPIDELDDRRKAGLFDRLTDKLLVPPVPIAHTASALSAGRTLAIAVASLGIGVGAGITLDRSVLAPPPASAPQVMAPAPTSNVTGEAAYTATAYVSSLPAAPPPATARVAVVRDGKEEPSRSADGARGLAAERAILDVARAALARGEGAPAIEAVRRHEREFPDGVLVEEREAIAVRALVAQGRRDEARARAAEFRRRFPNSVSLHAVNAAVGAEP
jgi:hypothetical protein